MDQKEIRSEVENIVRSSEVKAVVRAMRSGNRSRIGQTINYEIEAPSHAAGPFAPRWGLGLRRERPYQFAIEQWHLDEAERMIDHS